jgi:aryl-alcohol dehydrogenase-like predicted oxidoreductase
MNMGTDMPEMLAVCDRYDQASIVRSPLGSGNMTGKFTRDSKFPEDDWRRDWNSPSEFLIQRRQRIAEIGKYFAKAGDERTLAQIALAWIWTRSNRTIPIPGFKSLAQVKENIQAMEFGLLSKEQTLKIDEIFGRIPANS